jgi:hypothetical protein
LRRIRGHHTICTKSYGNRGVTLSARHDVREGVGRKISIICNLGLIRCAADRSYNHLISFILRLSVRFCTNRVVTPTTSSIRATAFAIRHSAGSGPGCSSKRRRRGARRWTRRLPNHPDAAVALPTGVGGLWSPSWGERPNGVKTYASVLHAILWPNRIQIYCRQPLISCHRVRIMYYPR